MPKLPDKAELGQAAQPNRQSVTISGQGQDTGQAMLGAVAEGVGKIGSVMTEIELSEKKKDDALDLVRAESHYKGILRDTEDSLRQDPDHASYKPKWFESSAKGIEDASASIRDPRTRELWKAKARAEAETGYGRISNFAHQRATQEKEVEIENVLKTYENQYLRNGITDDERKRVLDDADQVVRLGEKSGLVLPHHAQRLRDKHVNGLIASDIERQIAIGQSREVLKKLGYADQAAPGSARAAQEEPGLSDQPATGPRSMLGAGPRFNKKIDSIIDGAAAEHGVDPALMRTYAKIESGGDPSNQTGSYKGLFQLSAAEFRKYGGTGDIFDPQANAQAAARKLKAESDELAAKLGRQPTPTELYMVHQQGEGGAAAHASNPDAPAWKNMHSTAEGRGKGEAWAKRAIWGNIPDADKKEFGSVENVTSKDFLELWERKVQKFSGEAGAPRKGKIAGGGSGDGDVEFENLPAMENDGLYSRLSTKQRHALIHQARNALRGDTKRELADGLERLRNTGEEPVDSEGMTAIERARKERVLDPNQLSDFEAKYKTTRAIYKATASVYDMTDEQIEEEKRKWDPQINPQIVQELGYAGAMTVVADIDKMQKRVNDLRMKDAASAADQSTEVQQVIRKAQYLNPELQIGTDQDGNVRVIDKAGQPIPDATFNSELIRARLEAQERWGIPEAERKIISRGEANELLSKKAVERMKDSDLREYVKAAANKAEREYGKEHAEEAVNIALGWAMNKDNAEQHGRMARSIINGEASRADIEKYMSLDKLRSFGDYMDMPMDGRSIRTRDSSRPAISPMQAQDFSQSVSQYAQQSIDRRHIEALRANRDNPAAIESFDRTFGPGSAAKALSTR